MTAYPDAPGYKESGTSKEAARNVESQAEIDRAASLAYLRANPGKTPDEVAAGLGRSILSIRPRFTELYQEGLIVRDGRGVNVSGHAAYRYRVATDPKPRPKPPANDDVIDF